MTKQLSGDNLPEAKLLKKDARPPHKISIDIELPIKITEEQLRQAAMTVYKAVRGSQYKQVFVLWYLPGMKLDACAWASTNFDPDLKINIMDWMLESNPPNRELL